MSITLLESALKEYFGVSLYGFSTFIFSKAGSMRRTAAVMGHCSTLLFLICTSHFVLVLTDFVNNAWNNGINGASNGSILNIPETFLGILANFLGEAMLVYRLWLFYRKCKTLRWLIVVPAVACLGGLVTAMVPAGYAAVIQLTGDFDIVSTDIFSALVTAGYLFPLCNNVMVTALITGRIMYITYKISGHMQLSAHIHHAVAVIVESGLLYLAMQSALVGTYQAMHPALTTLSLAVVQIYGIAPTMIILGVNAGFLKGETTLDRESISTGAHTMTVPLFPGVHFADTKNTTSSFSAGQRQYDGDGKD